MTDGPPNPEPILLPEKKRSSGRVAHCRNQVANFQKLAAVARDQEARRLYLEAARTWSDMAEQAERLGW